jgi:hypothetical protein
VKIKTYEQSGGNRVILVADNEDSGGDYPFDSNEVSLLIPGWYSVKKIHFPGTNPGIYRQMLLDEINVGCDFIN